MSMELFKQEETTRLLKWIANNSRAWNRICGKSSNILSPEDYWHYFKLLKDLKFYDLLFVFITNNHESIATYDFFYDLGILKLSEIWGENTLERLEQYISQEVDKQNRRYESLE